MLTSLPKDVLWLIIKEHLLNTMKIMGYSFAQLYTYYFDCRRVIERERYIFEKTFSSEMDDDAKALYVKAVYFVDYLYPLRFTCKKIDALLRQKITYHRIGSMKTRTIKVAN
jgi:hypothetical protein